MTSISAAKHLFQPLRRAVRYVAIGTLLATTLAATSIVALDDSLSRSLRQHVENHANGYLHNAAARARDQRLSPTDRVILHCGAVLGIALTRFQYPEASILLSHYLYGDGSELELPSDYFQQSDYLNTTIARLGNGDHGPLTLHQAEDWRFSLALNPYFLNVTDEQIRVYHPDIQFASLDSTDNIFTLIPVGKLTITFPDQLITALNPTAFPVYAEWTR